jgi:eukaryotic-like serine/threonine-protein kinase
LVFANFCGFYMKSERWKEIERLYNAAMELDPARQAAFLVEACAGDASLQAEVGSLLVQRCQSGSFIEAPALEKVAQDLVADSPPIDDAPIQPHRRAPWWMCALAVIFIIPTGVRYYAYLMAPEEPGTAVQPILDRNANPIGIRLVSVEPGSPAAKAGLEGDDIILESSGFWTLSSKANSGVSYWKSGHPYRIDIERSGERRTIFLTLGRGRSVNWATAHGLIVHHGLTLIMILGIFVAFARPYDPTARWGVLFLAAISLGAWPIMATPGAGITLERFPRAIEWISVLIPWLLRGGTVFIALTFVCVFPRRFFRRTWSWALIWIPALIVIPAIIFSDVPPLYSFPQWWPGWYGHLVRALLLAGYCACGVVLVLNYRGLTNLNERRRVRVVILGLAIAGVSLLPISAATFLGMKSLALYIRLFPIPIRFGLTWIAIAFPISIGYAILRHRLFEIRLMIRLGLKYAVARGALLSLVPITGIIFMGDLFSHRSQPLADIMSRRAWFYGLLAGGAFLLHNRRSVWLDRLDRRFFREHYNVQHVLRAVVDEIRGGRDFEKVAPRVVEQIASALHPEFASLLLKQPGESKYGLLASSAKGSLAIPADSKFIGMARLLGKPLEVSQSRTGWIRQLPQQEINFLQQARIEWLFPVSLIQGQNEAFLALGPKRSEEPYSWEDQELLQAITNNMALLLDQASQDGFEECPECGTCYDSGAGKCQKEGSNLMPLALPRILARRYRFDQRLGAGGMGIVYESLDTELRRRVAVKLMRPDLTVSPEAIARFRREAQSAASFTHPNVVTVHDFGVAEGQRAYLVMELLKGSTLRQELNRRGRLAAPRALEILGSVCNAVSVAHHRNLLHRDLKPENIFLVYSEGVEIPKILDFGIAKPIAGTGTTSSLGQTESGILLGTLKYMSPEELRGERPAESWDLWALAVVAYEMLTGAHPFNGSTTLGTQNAILAGKLTPLNAYFPEAPASWQRFFDHALAMDVESRPTSVLQLNSNFRDAIADLKSA